MQVAFVLICAANCRQKSGSEVELNYGVLSVKDFEKIWPSGKKAFKKTRLLWTSLFCSMFETSRANAAFQ